MSAEELPATHPDTVRLHSHRADSIPLRYRGRKCRASHTARRTNSWHDQSVPRRVLIIDDNSGFRAAARQLLERAGFVVVAEAASGSSGIREAKEHKPDLVIVDVQLPDCDGFAVVEQLVGLDPGVAMILTSSLDGMDLGALVEDSSALGFIPKAELSAQSISELIDY